MDVDTAETNQTERGGSTAGDHSYKIIRSQILGGVYAGGARLIEEELAPLCGVSRTPVREALRRLASEGLVEMTPRYGVRVIGVDALELREIYDLRAMIESHAAHRAATRLTKEHIDELRMLADRMLEWIAQGPETVRTGFMPDNARYHRIILEAADSPRLLKMSALVVELPLTIRALLTGAMVVRDHPMNDHHEMVSAFEHREPEWAESLMRSHILSAYHGVVKNQIRAREEARAEAEAGK